MMRRPAAALVAFAALAAAAVAFEFTAWTGTLECTNRYKVYKQPAAASSFEDPDTVLETQTTTFQLSSLQPAALDIDMQKRSARNYSVRTPAEEDSARTSAFLSWVQDKVRGVEPLSTFSVATAKAKGSFKLIDGFSNVKVSITITYTGTLMDGTPVKGKLVIRGTLPRALA